MALLGLDNTLKALKGIGSNEESLNKALSAAADQLRDAAKQRCESSTVAEKIRSRKVNTQKEKVIYVVEVRHERAAIEEFGSGAREGRRGPHNFPARSFMRRSADEDWRSLGKTVEEIMGGNVAGLSQSGNDISRFGE